MQREHDSGAKKVKARKYIVDKEVLSLVEVSRERVLAMKPKDRLDHRIEDGRLLGLQSAQITDFAQTIANINVAQSISEKTYEELTKRLKELTLGWLDLSEWFTKNVPTKDETQAKLEEEVTEKLIGKQADSRLIS